MTENVNHPAHYIGFSNGAEVIDITENLNFNRGSAVKYLARAGRKDSAREVEDLEKASWYVKREIRRLVNCDESKSSPDPTSKVLREVAEERARQDEQWGRQDHPYTGGLETYRDTLRDGYGEHADDWKETNAIRVTNNNLGMDGILLEEVYEALCEDSPERQREEMIQVAAVAVMIIESIDHKIQNTNN